MATYGEERAPLINDFLLSLKEQSFIDFELIVVDQNEGTIVHDLVKDDKWLFPIKYLKSEPGLSRARNVGLVEAKGRIICFPDDDCIFPLGLLNDINHYFKNNEEIDLLAIDTRDTRTLEKLPYTKKAIGDFKITKNDIFKTITSISIFGKNFGDVFFDEKLGLGTAFHSCEEFDFVTQYLKQSKKCFFTDKFYVLHPNHIELSNKLLLEKIKKHGLGHGAYFKKHLKFILPTVLYYMIVSPIGGFILGVLTLNFSKAKMYWTFFVVRLRGFLTFKMS
jgi:glycosyltransferase involved in cell wall biosynthesis